MMAGRVIFVPLVLAAALAVAAVLFLGVVIADPALPSAACALSTRGWAP